MDCSCLPNVTSTTGSYCHVQPYTQPRCTVETLPSMYGQTYNSQIPMQWVKPNITAESLNQASLDEYLLNEYFQSGRNGQGALWKQAQQMPKSSKIRKCLCSCTSGFSQCTCGFSSQQEKHKQSSEQSSLQWLDESMVIQRNQINMETRNPHQSFTVPSSTYEYPYYPDYPENIACAQALAARCASLPGDNPSLSNNVSVKPSVFSTYNQFQKNTPSPQYDSSQADIKTPAFNQFPKAERSSPPQCDSTPQCDSNQVNPPITPRTRRKRPRLCHFILELLADPQQYSNIVEWVDQENGIFKFLNSSEIASIWGKRRDKPHMKYENFARSLRTYIAKGIMTKPRSRLVYRFTDKVL